ncbi:MAG TPA: hypothetical protein VNB94_08845 [Mycobacteriales bacterium]|nr:hypothetical protein [Mycobacteriales bacterium]
MDDESFTSNLGISRRTLIKRGAVVGGGLVWAAPMVQTLATPAFAQGSPACRPSIELTNNQGACTRTSFNNQRPECCDCIAARKAAGDNAFRAAVVCNSGPNPPCDFSDANAQDDGPCSP